MDWARSPFHGGLGFEAVAEFVAERVVGFAIFGGQEADLAGETVTEVVAAGVGFAFVGFRTGRMLCVAAIGFELLFCGHKFPSGE